MLVLLLGFLHELEIPFGRDLCLQQDTTLDAGDHPKQDYLRVPRPGNDATVPNKNTSKTWEWKVGYLSSAEGRAMADNLMKRVRLARKEHSTWISSESMWHSFRDEEPWAEENDFYA